MRSKYLALVLTIVVNLPVTKASSEVLLIDQNNWKLQVSGFVEADIIADSTRSFREIIGNSPVATSNSANGANARTQTSIRNSRLSFVVTPPSLNGWKNKAVMEFDLLGYNPNISATANNSEASLYNNPTFRVRHSYLKSENDGFELLFGQTWELFGWQSYYFMPSVSIAPLPGLAFARTAQLRTTKNWTFDGGTLSSAIAILRPPQSDAATPDLQAGLRWAACCRSSGYMMGGASARKLEPMSAALSATLRQINVPSNNGAVTDTTNYNGSALAANIFIPILSSSEKNLSNTLSLVASYTQGSGYGDQFSGFTGGAASNLLANTANLNGRTTAQPSLDGGIGDYDANNNFNLIQITTYNVNLQYHLPNDMPDWVSLGFGVLTSDNMNNLVTSTGKTSGGSNPYDQERVYYANYFHEFSPQTRLGAEYDYVDTRYGNGGVIAKDTRVQVSGYFIF